MKKVKKKNKASNIYADESKFQMSTGNGYSKSTPWCIRKIKEIANINQNNVGKNYEYNTIKYLDTSSITQNKIDKFTLLQLNKAPSRAKRLVRDKSIVYSTVRPNLRHAGVLQNPAPNTVVSTGFAVIDVDPQKVDPIFVYSYLMSDEIVARLQVIAESSKSTYPAIRPSDIATIPIPLPPLKVQKQIVARVEDFNKKMLTLKEGQGTLKARVKKMRAAVLQHALNGQLT